MTKIDIFSGFLGAGKTTLIKKLIGEAYIGEKVVLIENEFGEIGIDGGFLQDAGVEITEMNSGCICCSLVGDFGDALKKVILDFLPDRILIEPSGVGKLSDVIKAAQSVTDDNVVINGLVTVADANRFKMYMKNFGEFFNDQIKHANTVVLSHTDSIASDKVNTCIELIKKHNHDAVIITTPWNDLDGHVILETIENKNTLEQQIEKLHHKEACHSCSHHHHDHREHYNHHDCECHEHRHVHDSECSCGCHGHGDHHHHADEVFTSWGKETACEYSEERIKLILSLLDDSSVYGTILRAKGIVPCDNGKWLHFDYVPGEYDVRVGNPSVTGRICVIGSNINEEKLVELFDI